MEKISLPQPYSDVVETVGYTKIVELIEKRYMVYDQHSQILSYTNPRIGQAELYIEHEPSETHFDLPSEGTFAWTLRKLIVDNLQSFDKSFYPESWLVDVTHVYLGRTGKNLEVFFQFNVKSKRIRLMALYNPLQYTEEEVKRLLNLYPRNVISTKGLEEEYKEAEKNLPLDRKFVFSVIDEKDFNSLNYLQQEDYNLLHFLAVSLRRRAEIIDLHQRLIKEIKELDEKLIDKMDLTLTLQGQNSGTSRAKVPKRLVVLTLNVEFFSKALPEVIYKEIVQGRDELPDVICLQESFKEFNDQIRETFLDYDLVESCQAEPLLSNHLSNDILIRKGLNYSKASTLDLPSPKSFPVPRCATYVEVEGISIVNVHLSGGRYEDADFLHNLKIKSEQIEKIIETYHPDIVLGDMNAIRDVNQMDLTLSKYPLYTKLKPELKKSYLQYYGDFHKMLDQNGYQPAYDESLGSTSVFGALVDWFYYLPNKIEVQESRVVPFIEKGLSDHNGVEVTLEIKS